jgi:hypothetical protein
VLTFMVPLPGIKLNIFLRIERKILLVLKVHHNLVHQILQLYTWRIHYGDSIDVNQLATPVVQPWLLEANT